MISNLYLQRKCGGTEKCDRSCPALQSVDVPGATKDRKNCVMLNPPPPKKNKQNTPKHLLWTHLSN